MTIEDITQETENKLFKKVYVDRTDLTICWPFCGGTGSLGYGKVRAGRKQLLAHRISFVLYNGPIEDNLQIDHICRLRNCVNPTHLRQVTIKQNVLAGTGITAQNLVKTHCVNGHELNAQNTHVRMKGLRKGRRECKICMKTRYGGGTTFNVV